MSVYTCYWRAWDSFDQPDAELSCAIRFYNIYARRGGYIYMRGL